MCGQFYDYLVPDDDQFLGKTPRTMVDDDDWLPLAKGLLDCGICHVDKESEIHSARGSPLS